MEVGVCAEAYGQEMSISRRHINSAFMTFVVLDEEGQTCTLPMVAPEPGVRTGRDGLASPRRGGLGPPGILLGPGRQNKSHLMMMAIKLLDSE